MKPSDDVSRWERMMSLLGDALDLPPAQQQVFVDAAAGGDVELHAQLSALVAAAAVENSMLDAPPTELTLDALKSYSVAPWIGRRLGPYRLVELIGGGGMGQVYLAERVDGQYEQRVAIKLMRDGFGHATLVSRFKVERQILASLDHPHLAKMLDGGITEEGVPYFVMELITGEPIDVYCQSRSLSITDRARLFRTVAQVVHYAHQRGVIHRDLKPANILVTRDGVVKLVDFGIAKQVSTEPATATAQHAMTLDYASPEQVRGEAVTPASDIFSLGVVLYQLLADSSPYAAGTSDYELTKAICDTEPQPPSAHSERTKRRQLRGDLDAVVMMALRKDPARRYASAEHLGDDLFRHVEGLPVQARRGAWSYRAGRFVLRHKAMVGAALVANLALVAGIALASYQAYEAHLQRERADAQRVRAERHFASVRQLANIFIVDVDRAILGLSGANPARKLVVDKALVYLKALSDEAGNDASLRIELAAGYRKVGDIEGKPYRSNLNEPDHALDSYRKGAALVEPLVTPAGKNAPQYRLAQQELARAYESQGALLGWMGKSKDADLLLRKAVVTATDLVASDPGSIDFKMTLSRTYDQHGRVLLYLKDFDGYLKASEGAIETLTAALVLWPDYKPAVAGLANVYNTRGLYHMQRDTTEQSARDALADFEKSMLLLRPLIEENPDDMFLAGQYAGKLENMALALNELRDFRRASQQLDHAIRVLTLITTKDRGDDDAKVSLAMAHTMLGTTLLRTGNAARSLENGLEAENIYASLPAAARNAPEPLTGQRDNYNGLGLAAQALTAAGVKTDACKFYRLGLQVALKLESIVGTGPADYSPQHFREALQTCSQGKAVKTS